ncbi:MAG: hypothetical protein KDD11_19910, partial [Acidobacteria bacterium]|nr:hypothetical protein [Acidobacteriota bacterium]
TLVRRLAGDLDAVVLKTLAFDREERYGSVSELAADLDRVLHHRSVTVRDAPWPERALRLVRRHAAASVAVAVAVALLTAAVALATLALVRGARAEAEAQREAEATRQALAFVVDLFEAASPGQAQDQDLNAQELLDLGRERIRGLDLPPLERARLLEMLAETNLRLERFDQAREAAVTAYSLRRSELGDDAPELEASASLLRRIDSAERAHAESTG